MNPNPGDLTPLVGAPTDVAPLGTGNLKLAHERPAGEGCAAVDWDRVAASRAFTALLKKKAAFIIPAVIFFIVYYFALLILVGYKPHLMETKVLGVVNLAYLFALSQFFMAWIIAALYVKAAAGHDRMAQEVINNVQGGK